MAQTNPRGRPQHIWSDCTRFTLGNPESDNTVCIPSLIVIQIRRDKQYTSRGGSGDFEHRLPKHKCRQRNLQPNINEKHVTVKPRRSARPNKQHTQKGSEGIHCGPARLKTSHIKQRGGRAGKKEVNKPGHE